MEKFIWGTQYLRGVNPAESEWERDLANVSAAGFNTIRVWLVWGTIEKEEGKFDLAPLGRLFDLAERNHLKVIVLFHLHGAPEWAIRKYPQYRYVNWQNVPFEPCARANTPSGGWPGLCPDHEEVQQLEARFITAVTTFIGDRAYAYEPINEPHEWLDGGSGPLMGGTYCYCEASRRKYREWLQKKYGSLAALGEAWGMRFDAWESVRPPTWEFGYANWVDFRDFTADSVAELVARRAAVIRQHSSAPVIAHAWGGGAMNCAQLGGMVFDDWRNSRPLDLWGCSGFPGSAADTAKLALSMDATRSAAQGKTFWQSELGAGTLGIGTYYAEEASPELLASWCWRSLFSGAKGLLFWQYRIERDGNESLHYGLTDRKGRATPRLLAAKKVAESIAQHEEAFLAAKRKDAEVGIIFNFRSFVLDWAIHKDNLMSCDAAEGYYNAFFHADVPVDVFHVDHLPESIHCKLLIVPASLTLSQAAGEKIARFVRQGGSVIIDPFTASWDEHCRLNDEMPGAGLTELCGAEEDRVLGNREAERSFTFGGKAYAFPAKLAWQNWRLLAPDTEVLAQDETDGILMTARRCGQGRAILSGIPLGNLNRTGSSLGDDFRGNGEMSTRNTAEIILELARQAGVNLPAAAPFRSAEMILPDGQKLLLHTNLSAQTVPLPALPDGAEVWYGSADALPPYGSTVIFSIVSREHDTLFNKKIL